MGNLVDADAGIACFDAKYHYTFWRPVTAIRNADIDGNDATTADSTWSPLLTTPNHPEYPAAHGCLTAADAEVYAELAHTHRIDVDIPGATGGGTTLTTTRHYATSEDLKKEIVNARVWAGLHYRFSGEAGVTSERTWHAGACGRTSGRRSTTERTNHGPGSVRRGAAGSRPSKRDRTPGPTRTKHRRAGLRFWGPSRFIALTGEAFAGHPSSERTLAHPRLLVIGSGRQPLPPRDR